MAVDIGPKIGLDGESEFRKQLQNVNQSLKTLGSEMKLVTAEFAANADSEEALTKKNDVLERSVSTLRDKLEMQQKALQESAQKFGEADARTMKWQQAVNETEAALATAENQIKENTNAIDKLGDETEETGAEFKNAGKEAASFGDVLKANVLGDLIIKGVEALATGVKKLGKAFKDAIVDGAAYADEISSMSEKTGLSTDTLQEFKYMADLVDVDLNTITGALSKLTKNMNSARKGTGDTAAAFEKLDVNITNADGSLRDNEAVFNDTLEALGNVANETERDALAMQIFGKSAQELNPLVVAGADTIARYAQEAHDMGYVLDSEALESLNNVQDSFDRLHAATDGVKNQLAQALAPTIEELAAKLQEFIANIDWTSVGEKIQSVADKIKEFFNFISENGSTIAAVLAAIGAGFVAWNVASMVMGLVEAIKAFQLANEGATIAQAALNVVLSANPIGIVITAVAALVAAIVTLWNTNEEFRNWCINTWNAVIEWIKTAVDNVVTWVSNAWENIKKFFQNAPEWFLSIGKNIVEGLWNGIKNATQWLIGKITGWFNDVVGAVKNFLGIESPSKKFAEIGEYSAMGFGEGFDNEFSSVSQKVVGDIQKTYDKALAAARKSIDGQIKLFDRFADEVKGDTATVEQMLETWAEQTENLDRYTRNLKKAAEYGIDRGLVESFSDGSSKSSAYINTIIARIEELGVSTEGLSEDAQSFVDEFNNAFRRTGEAKDTFAKTATEISGAADDIKDNVAAVNGVIAELQKQYEETYQSARDSIGGQVKLFDEFTVKVSKETDSVDEMTAIWAKQAENLDNYTENLRKAASYGIDAKLLETLSDGSAESVGYIATIVAKIEELGGANEKAFQFITDFNAAFQQTEQAKDNFAATVADIQNNFVEMVDDIQEEAKDFKDTGELMIDNMIKGLDEKCGNLYGKVMSIVNDAIYYANFAASTALPDASANAGVISSMQPATNAGLAESVNAIGTLMGGAGSGNLNIVIQADGREFYRATLEDFRLVQAQNPIIVNDF